MKKIILLFIIFVIIMSCSKTSKNELKHVHILQSRDSFYINAITYGIKDEIKSKNLNVDIETYNLESNNLSAYEVANKIKNKDNIIITVGDLALSFAIDAFPTNPIIASGIIDTKALSLLNTSKLQNGNISGVYYIANVTLYIEDLLKIFNINSLGYIEYKGFKYADIMRDRIESGAKLNKIRFINYPIDDILNIKDELKLKRRAVDVVVVLNNIPLQSVYEYTLNEAFKQNIAVISFEPILDSKKPLLFSVSPNYYRMGRATANMAIDILNGKSIEDMDIINMTNNYSVEMVVNKDIAKKLGIQYNESAIEMLVNKVIEDETIKSVIR